MASVPDVTAILVAISGFGQPPNRRNGTKVLVDKAIKLGFQHAYYYKWLVDPAEIAAFIMSLIKPLPYPLEEQKYAICLCGHSFGGDTDTKVAVELEKHGIVVDLMLLTDAVNQATLKGNLHQAITVPANVVRGTGWRRASGMPRGGPFELHQGALWTEVIVEGESHSQMSSLPAFHEAALTWVKQYT